MTGRTMPLLAALAAGVLAAAPAGAAGKPGAARGKYIVERVGMCGDCHSPRGPGGFIEGQWLHGATLGFKPTMEMPWAPKSPRIAGIPEGYSKAQLVTFLSTGKRPDGSAALPPMPEYRMSKADAESVADYLAGLK